ncbi:MAG: uridylate kinase, partial [Acidobacteriota bacterium]
MTDKKGRAADRPEVIRRVAGEIADALPEMSEALILGHGSGSFGHVAAAENRLRAGAGPRPSPLGAARVQRAAAEL